MAHNIPVNQITKHTRSISDSKRTQVANLQKHIQDLLGDTHHTFLQGSYKNDTSISDINDVDIVAVRKTTFSAVHTGRSFPTSILWDTIFTEIENKLKNQNLYQWTVVRGDKCIQVRTSTFKADVVPAVQIDDDVQLDPIAIYSFKTGLETKNRPRTHYENGVTKHALTEQRYKPVVRMFKNWAVNYFGDTIPLSSYQIESLVHSAPNDNFFDDHAMSFLLISSHILDLLNKNISVKSVCGTEDVTTNWDVTKRKLFKDKLGESFLNAHKGFKASTIQEAESYWNKAFNV